MSLLNRRGAGLQPRTAGQTQIAPLSLKHVRSRGVVNAQASASFLGQSVNAGRTTMMATRRSRMSRATGLKVNAMFERFTEKVETMPIAPVFTARILRPGSSPHRPSRSSCSPRRRRAG